jgi:hypothetical protein
VGLGWVEVGRRFNKGNGHLSKQEWTAPLSTGRIDNTGLPNDALLEDEDTLGRGRTRVSNKNVDERASYR